MDDLRDKILSEPTILRVFNAGMEAFLVGGYLRDILRGVRSRDIDFVIKGDPKNVISRIFPGSNKTIIEFKKVHLVRVVMGDVTIDFSELKGRVEDDLNHRDFTMNAIAWSPEKGIIDPLDGTFDIEKCTVRAISERNFMDDPLRLLRAYRFAGELGWLIDRGTRKAIRKLKNSIKQCATERITLEIFKLLNSDVYLSALKIALRDGLLHEILSIDNNQLRDNIKALSRFNSFLKRIPEEYMSAFNRTFSQDLSYIGLLRAEQLLYMSNLEENNLRLSRAILKRLVVTAKLLGEYKRNRDMDSVRIFDIFEEVGDAIMDFALLTGRERLLKKAERFAHISPALQTEEVMEIAGLGSGPELGRILNELRKLQFLGKIKSKNDVKDWLTHKEKSTH